MNWFANEIQFGEQHGAIIRIYITGTEKGSISNMQTVSNDKDDIKSSHEEIFILEDRHIQKGRPDFCIILQNLKRDYPNCNASVAVCGSNSLLKDVRIACNQVSDNQSLFSLHHEAFEF